MGYLGVLLGDPAGWSIALHAHQPGVGVDAQTSPPLASLLTMSVQALWLSWLLAHRRDEGQDVNIPARQTSTQCPARLCSSTQQSPILPIFPLASNSDADGVSPTSP
jgi:hypothetical protein